jgi:ketosteroid isomerase-like protein
MKEELQPAERITQLENSRYAAMLGKDIGTLERLLDDKLIYMHSSGVVDTKSSYIDGLRSGVWDYQQIDRTDVRIEISRDVALVFGKLSIRMNTRGAAKAFSTRALAIWQRGQRGESGWTLLAVHSGAIPESH